MHWALYLPSAYALRGKRGMPSACAVLPAPLGHPSFKYVVSAFDTH
jgi:hypothetical protein